MTLSPEEAAENRRPFRHLCPEADAHDAMDNEEFWEHVFNGDHAELDMEAMETPASDLPVTPCEVCGSTEGACGYDEEGRPMVHCTNPEAAP